VNRNGFYFGVVVRDFSDLCATSIAVKGKFYKEEYGDKKKGKRLPDRTLDKNTCALCANKMNSNSTLLDSNLHQITNNSNDTRLQQINLDDFNDTSYGRTPLLTDTQKREPNTSDDEKTIRISCGHEFHEYCIRGWVILGKQSTCPYCNEKVDTKILGNHPWEKYNRMYATLLGWLRYLVAWQPVILLIINGVTHLMGLE
jgi:RING finger protein 121